MISKVINFAKEVKQEAKKVTWPTRKDTTITVILVLILVAISAVFFLLVDLGISKIISLILGI